MCIIYDVKYAYYTRLLAFLLKTSAIDYLETCKCEINKKNVIIFT